MAAFPGWEVAVLHGIGARPTPANLRALNAWARAEGGTARFNPLNTTEEMPGATPYNHIGVRNYANPQAGIQATVRTLTNGHYGGIVHALREGTDPMAVAQAIGSSPWGTSGELVAKVLGGHLPPMGHSAPPAPTPQPLTPQNDPMFPMLESLMTTGKVSGGDLLTALESPSGQKIPVVSETGGKVSRNAVGIIHLARQYLGTPYQWGGTTPKGFDCSGFVQFLYAREGINLPRTTYEQFKVGTPVKENQLQAGDIVFFEPSSQGPGHEGLYIGHGQFIQAPHTGDVVKISNLRDYQNIYVGARRVH